MTICVTGLGLAIGGTLGATVITGLGINLSSNIIHGGCAALKDRWLYSENGIVNHDIQKMLIRAFCKAIVVLRVSYLKSENAKNLRLYERYSIKRLFSTFSRQAEKSLPRSLGDIQMNVEVRKFLFSSPSQLDTEQMWHVMVPDDLLKPYGSDFQTFMRRELLSQILIQFGEELKTDSKECNRSWRAFQRLLLEGIYESVKSIRADQNLIIQDLRKLDSLNDELEQLRNAIDHRQPDELFQKDLRLALDNIQRSINEIRADSDTIVRYVEIIHRDVQTLLANQLEHKAPTISSEAASAQLSQIRKKMLIADSQFALKETYYEIEALLAVTPQNAEALHLEDQIKEALSYYRAPIRHSPAKVENAGWEFTIPELSSIATAVIAVSALVTFVGIRMFPTQKFRSSGLNIASETNVQDRYRRQQQEIDYWNRRVELSKSKWRPQMRETFDLNVSVLNTTIDDSLRRLSQNPHDEVSEDILNAAVRDKIALLKEFSRF